MPYDVYGRFTLNFAIICCSSLYRPTGQSVIIKKTRQTGFPSLLLRAFEPSCTHTALYNLPDFIPSILRNRRKDCGSSGDHEALFYHLYKLRHLAAFQLIRLVAMISLKPLAQNQSYIILSFWEGSCGYQISRYCAQLFGAVEITLYQLSPISFSDWDTFAYPYPADPPDTPSG